MLANVIALVRQTGRSDAPVEVRLDILSKRITSRAKTHDILTRTRWRATPIRSILRADEADDDEEDFKDTFR